MKQTIFLNLKKGGLMGAQELTRLSEKMPSLFSDFFKPWNEWLDNSSIGRVMNVPAVNIVEIKDGYILSLAAPGKKKSDFKIDIDGNLLTISSEASESKEEKDEKFTRKEYSYSSFSRSFTLPDEVNMEKIDAKYEDGVLKINLPCNENLKKTSAKQIAVK